MIIILADGSANFELDETVNRMAEEFGRARSALERDRIAEKIYALVGPRLKAMLANSSKGLKLSAQDLNSLAWKGLWDSLSNTAMSKIQRSDCHWENLIERLRTKHPTAKRVWNELTPQLRKVLDNTNYLKSTIADALVRELNGLLRLPNFYDTNAWAGVTLRDEARVLLGKGIRNLSATELTRFNLLALTSAFPELKAPEAPPSHNLIGYFAKFILPKSKQEIAELAGLPPMSEYLIEAKNLIRPIVEELTQMKATGTLPANLARMSLAEQIYTRQKDRTQARYGKIIAWYNEQVKKFQPRNPFLVNSPAALRDARQLLKVNHVPEPLWAEKTSPNFLPGSALEPIGVSTIQKVLDLTAPKLQAPPRSQAVRPTQPSSSSSGDTQTMNLLQGGHGAPAYRYLVQKLFDEGQAEHSIGMFLANNPKPTRGEIEQFTSSLPDDLADDVKSVGWDRLVYQIDRQILDAVRDPNFRTEVERALQMAPSVVASVVDSIRRTIFFRTARYINLRTLVG